MTGNLLDILCAKPQPFRAHHYKSTHQTLDNVIGQTGFAHHFAGFTRYIQIQDKITAGGN